MSAGWVAGTVRAKAMARRELGADAARRLAACRSLAEAQGLLAGTAYRAAGQPGLALAGAQHAVAATLLWDLRVLAGWLPRDGVDLLRTLAGWFEIANVDDLLGSMAGHQSGDEFQLGALGTAWSRLRRAASPAALRTSLAGSPWRDPGSDAALEIQLAMRARWAARVADAGEPLRTWATAGAAQLLAAARFAARRPVQPAVLAGARALVGPVAAGAMTLELLGASLPGRARWALADAATPETLWRAEAAWWRRVEQEGRTLLATSGPDSRPVVGATAVMAADARRVGAALEGAARGGVSAEAYDAVA